MLSFINEKDENPATLDQKLLRLPASLSESIEALENNNVLREMIGEKLFTAIKGVRKVSSDHGFQNVNILDKVSIHKLMPSMNINTYIQAEIQYYSKNKDAYKQLIHRY